MKIIFLNIYGGINNRGVETFSNTLANQLNKNHQVIFIQAGEKSQDQDFQVLTIKSDVRQPQERFSSNFVANIAKRLFCDAANRSVLNFTKKALPYIKQEKPDVIIPLNGFLQILFLKLKKNLYKKMMVIGNSGPGWDERWNIYLKPDVFIATTEPAYHWLMAMSANTRIELIPYGIDVTIFQKTKAVELKMEKPIVFCPCALVSYKQVDLAIRAMALKSSGSLLVSGSGPLKNDLTILGTRLLGKRFKIISLDYSQIAGYYQASDLVTLPSLNQENSPMVFLESLASGKLVVTTDNPRSRWMLENAGIYCNPRDVEAYAKALDKAVMQTKTTTALNTRHALKKFKMAIIVDKYQRLFEEITRN